TPPLLPMEVALLGARPAPRRALLHPGTLLLAERRGAAPTQTGISPWRRSSAATCFSVGPARTPVRTRPSAATALK
ncbi:MAG: hypothetical protein K6T83_18210, partial [Alicyclobacillus sp.]|nr:hypothetical protein [Alicyclobacillus sp.]